MNKRIRKKKVNQTYESGIRHLVNYTELPRRIVEKEIGQDLFHLCQSSFTDVDFSMLYHSFLDGVSIYLMLEYETGWVGGHNQPNKKD